MRNTCMWLYLMPIQFNMCLYSLAYQELEKIWQIMFYLTEHVLTMMLIINICDETIEACAFNKNTKFQNEFD